ncbi:MAG: DUF1549 domain-containing protein [Rubripirellula sp.]
MPRIDLPLICLAILATSATAGQRVPSTIDYGEVIAPILSRHCLECHGPDAEQREAGLRLDSQTSATRQLESGSRAIVPKRPSASELLTRVTSTGNDRMPPGDHASALSATEVEQLTRWIEQGAKWESHWAFTAPVRVSPPSVQNSDWVQNPIDQFILAKLEQKSLTPRPTASPRKLVRRLYFDLTGLPPTPQQVSHFLADDRPNAWERLVDRLLASPQYGQRWGRHWLDVARYGDSNGGDENHAYPLAWRYRDYVISSFNEDLPFDAFVHEQLAGDLLADTTTEPSSRRSDSAHNDTNERTERKNARVTATGFLAMGTKILAEQDEVKKQADIVDEQIDTVGKTFLGLTLGCARCHDHKFDPIPTRDYYALAGIFHSTNLSDQPIQTDTIQQALREHQQQLERLTDERDRLQLQLDQRLSDESISLVAFEAETFAKGNVTSLTDSYGEGIGIISDRGAQKNFAEYAIEIPADGPYLIQLRYAAKNARPGRILINGAVVKSDAISQTTGGWMPEHQRWISEGTFPLKQGSSTLRLESEPLMSHIDKIRLIRAAKSNRISEDLAQLEQFSARLSKHKQQTPQPEKVMAATDGNSRDTRIHIRGSHRQLGDKVMRGFPAILSSASDQTNASAVEAHSIPGTQSGRQQLAYWMTDANTGTGGQTARVIVNRLWHWHFGSGLVNTPNNFGMQGSRPTHPDLLDWLALELIQHDWSMKWMHRMVVTSASYEQETSSTHNAWVHGFSKRRIEAEAIRDGLLMHGGSLSFDLVGQPLSVKTQDPSPADLNNNEAAYRSFRRRSVHLPVVRCNTHRFLTLYDFPNAATPVGSRDSTTVPTQALLLMNDPMVMQQAENIAQSILAQSILAQDTASKTQLSKIGIKKEDAAAFVQRIQKLYALLFQRPATGKEIETLEHFLRDFGSTVTEDQEMELKIWTAMVHTLLLSSEYIHVD